MPSISRTGRMLAAPFFLVTLIASAPDARAQCSGGYTVVGAINDKYQSLGGSGGFLGCPVTNELPTPDGIGRFNYFQGGAIYWTPSTGAWSIRGAILDHWAQLGWETSFLGYPVTDELTTPDGIGRYNHFQGGSIYWSPSTGAHEVHGDIRARWISLGWETGVLGYPVTDEMPTPDGVGRFNHFQGGSIYWTPGTGAWAVWGPVRDKWSSLGWETSALGYPISNVYNIHLGQRCEFQGGSIIWNSVTNDTIVITAANNVVKRAGQTIKIQQLTGEWDRQHQAYTLSRTESSAGVTATDLGSSFVHKGKLWFLFGDTWGRPGDRDSIAWADITSPQQLQLNFKKASDGKFLPITPADLPTGAFSVPSYGISVNNSIYMAFTTASGWGSMGASTMLRSDDDGASWIKLYQISADNPNTPQFEGKFINTAFWQDGDTVYMWGSGKYRASDLFLARTSASAMNTNSWQYFTGYDANGMPQWSSSQAAALPLIDDEEIGEFSAAWIHQLRKWVVLYNAGSPRGITMRVADNPWGPWSPGLVIFNPAKVSDGGDGGYGSYMHIPGQDNLSDPGRESEWGGEYGPYIIPSFTTGDPGSCHIYYTMSTWNPYQVVLMRSTVRLDAPPLHGSPVGSLGGWYRVQARNSGRYFDIAPDASASGSNLRQQDWTGGSNQIFQFEYQADGYYKIWAKSAGSGCVLNVENCSTAAGANVNQLTASGSDCQLFRVEDVGGGYVRLVARNSGRVFDVAGCSTSSGANIHLWDWWGGDCQQFKLEWVSMPVTSLSGSYRVTNVHSGKVLDIAPDHVSNGANLQQYDWLGGANQKFDFAHLGNGYYAISANSAGTGRVLDVEGVGTANGSNVIQFDWWGGDNQRWLVEDIGFGQVRLTAKNSGRALEVAGLSTANGGNVVIWDWWGGNNQRWVLEPVTASGPLEVIVDNTDPGFSASSNWFASTSMPGYLGTNYMARATEAVSDRAAWTVDLPTSGNYAVYARWAAGSNRAPSATYSITHSGGSQNVAVNQQINGGQYVYLGTWNFTAGSATRVHLSCWTTSGYFVIADAVRFVKQP